MFDYRIVHTVYILYIVYILGVYCVFENLRPWYKFLAKCLFKHDDSLYMKMLLFIFKLGIIFIMLATLIKPFTMR